MHFKQEFSDEMKPVNSVLRALRQDPHYKDFTSVIDRIEVMVNGNAAINENQEQTLRNYVRVIGTSKIENPGREVGSVILAVATWLNTCH